MFNAKLVGVAVNPMIGQNVNSVSDLHFASRLDLDINTAQERAAPLPSDKMLDLFNELVDLGNELSQKGDIP